MIFRGVHLFCFVFFHLPSCSPNRSRPAAVAAAVSPLEEGDAGHWLDEIVLVNPQIVASGKGKITDEEGCLSFPGMGGQVCTIP